MLALRSVLVVGLGLILSACVGAGYHQDFAQLDQQCRAQSRTFAAFANCYWSPSNHPQGYRLTHTDQIVAAEAKYLAEQERQRKITTTEAFSIYDSRRFGHVRQEQAMIAQSQGNIGNNLVNAGRALQSINRPANSIYCTRYGNDYFCQ
jgi:hypothetical protein